MKIGLIQARGIGDIIIALPIARYFADQGHTVVWPIHAPYVGPFQEAAPCVEFLPLAGEEGDWMLPLPLAALRERGCDRILALASYIGGHPELLARPDLAEVLKFDQYKYRSRAFRSARNGICRSCATARARRRCSRASCARRISSSAT